MMHLHKIALSMLFWVDYDVSNDVTYNIKTLFKVCGVSLCFSDLNFLQMNRGWCLLPYNLQRSSECL